MPPADGPIVVSPEVCAPGWRIVMQDFRGSFSTAECSSPESSRAGDGRRKRHGHPRGGHDRLRHRGGALLSARCWAHTIRKPTLVVAQEHETRGAASGEMFAEAVSRALDRPGSPVAVRQANGFPFETTGGAFLSCRAKIVIAGNATRGVGHECCGPNGFAIVDLFVRRGN